MTPNFNILKYQYEFDAIPIDKRGEPDQHLPAKLVLVNIEIDDRQWIIWAGKKILSEVEKEAFLGSLVVRYLKEDKYDFSNDDVPIITWEQLPAEIRDNAVNFERINFPPEPFLIRTGTQIGFST
ncbi:MAG: hypothetical protein ACYC0L_08255 [Thermoleophilia bacterium]